MKYLYKIHSGYDGFTPKKLPERMVNGKSLVLGWKQYLDAVEEGDEIWVYFHGQHKFENGVYAKGIAEDISYDEGFVLLRVNEWSSSEPLTDPTLSKRIADVVAVRYRQVFLLPETLEAKPVCDIHSTAASCEARLCGSCPTWTRMPTVNRRALRMPHRLVGHVDKFAPAYWVLARRNFLYQMGRPVRSSIQNSTDVFYRFKVGEGALAYPLALGMRKALAAARRLDFDAIVPVPLSPDKAEAGELHRTLALATELSGLLDAPVEEWLVLAEPISKRHLRGWVGLSRGDFEARYASKLETVGDFTQVTDVLLVDDVCTEGSTLRLCSDVIREANPQCRVTAVTAGQMTVKQVVADPTALLNP